MKPMNKATTSLLILFLALVIAQPIYAYETPPSIGVYPPPSRAFPLKIYVSQVDYNLTSGKTYFCPYRDRIIEKFYRAIEILEKSAFRFGYEHLEYRELMRLTFINVTSEKSADIVLRIATGINHSYAYVAFSDGIGEKPYFIYIVCREGRDYGDIKLFNLLLHEFFHALGLDHAKQPYTDTGEVEVMGNIADDRYAYPTTLNLYALYVTYFGKLDYSKADEHGDIILTLPTGMEYKAVKPYDLELRDLREENQELKLTVAELRNQLWELQDVVKEYEKLNETIKELQAELETYKYSVSSLQDTIADLETQKADLESQVENYKSQLEQAQEEISRLQGQLAQLSYQYQNLLSEKKSLEFKVKSLQQENQYLREKAQSLTQQSFILAFAGILLGVIGLSVTIYAKKKGVLT